MWRLQFLHFIWFSLAVILLQTACAWTAPDPSAFFSLPTFAQSFASAIDAFEEVRSFLSEEPSELQESQGKHKLLPLHMVAFLRGNQREDKDHLQRRTTRDLPGPHSESRWSPSQAGPAGRG